MKYIFSLYFLTLLIISFSVQAQEQKINTIAGNGEEGFAGDGHSAVAATLFAPLGVAVDKAGNVFIEDYVNRRVRRISAATGVITTVAGNGGLGYTGDGSYGASAQISPSGIAVDKNGNLFIADATYAVVRKVINSGVNAGIISRVVGSGLGGYAGDGGSATNARMRNCLGITFDNIGNLYIADAGNHVVRKVDTFGIITTVAGKDTAGYAGDGGAATAAKLDSPAAVATDLRGNLYITDYNNNVIRKVDDTGAITTYAGNHGLPAAYLGNGSAATAAQLNYAQGIACDIYGNLYIADANNNVIRKVDTFGIITTVVGNGDPGFGGDLGYVSGANLFNPYGVTVDNLGDIYIADANNERVRKTYASTNVGVNGVAQHGAIEVHPNPFSSQVYVFGLSQSDKVGVYDAVGRQVSEIFIVAENGTNAFNISSLTTGVYLLQVWDSYGNKKATVQLVKE